jgi:D-amino-acid dehydrogenase
MTVDTIVVGGGIVGAAAACDLARGGAKTLLIDQHHAGRATDAGAGIIAPETSGATLPVAWFPFAVACGAYYAKLIPWLTDEGAGETGYAVCGELVVAADEDELAAYEHKKAVIFARKASRGLPSDDDLREIPAEDARELFPALKQVLKALYFRGAARVDGRKLTAALLHAARRHGLNERSERVEQLVLDRGRVTGVRVQGETISAGHVIIAGGAWSAAFGAQLGIHIPVEPQRGQIIHLRLPGDATGGWPVVDAFHGHYMVAWPDSRVVAGATRETGAGFDPVTTASGVREVLSEALRVAPGLAGAEIGEIRVGLRPATPDHLPVLGEVPGIEGVYLATGHGANGLQTGPFSGALASAWARGNPPAVDLAAFSVARFGAGVPAAQDADSSA